MQLPDEYPHLRVTQATCVISTCLSAHGTHSVEEECEKLPLGIKALEKLELSEAVYLTALKPGSLGTGMLFPSMEKSLDNKGPRGWRDGSAAESIG